MGTNELIRRKAKYAPQPVAMKQGAYHMFYSLHIDFLLIGHFSHITYFISFIFMFNFSFHAPHCETCTESRQKVTFSLQYRNFHCTVYELSCQAGFHRHHKWKSQVHISLYPLPNIDTKPDKIDRWCNRESPRFAKGFVA